MYSWQSFRKRRELIGLKCPYDRTPPSRPSMLIDLIQWIVFCRTKTLRNAITISCGNIGFDGAEPTLRKNEPVDFRTRRTSAAHFSHHSKYVCRSCRSEYFW